MLSTSLCKQPCLLISVQYLTTCKILVTPLNVSDSWIIVNVTEIISNAPKGFDEDCNFLIQDSFMLRFVLRLQKFQLISFYQNFKIDRRVAFDPKGDQVKVFSRVKHHIRVSSRSSKNHSSQIGSELKGLF